MKISMSTLNRQILPMVCNPAIEASLRFPCHAMFSNVLISSSQMRV